VMTLRWVPGWNGLNEPEAVSYVAAVEAADGQELEFGVARAINDFVVGCKQDKIWDAIKACCILAGARTTNGALVPLVGTAPTPNNFDLVGDTDYDRKTGLVGDGSTKYLNSNISLIDIPVSSTSASVYISQAATTGTYLGSNYGGGGKDFLTILPVPSFNTMGFSSREDGILQTGASTATGFAGSDRSSTSSFTARVQGSNASFTRTAQTARDSQVLIFARNQTPVSNHGDGRLAFYSIGESLDLAALDTRVSNLITAIKAAIL